MSDANPDENTRKQRCIVAQIPLRWTAAVSAAPRTIESAAATSGLGAGADARDSVCDCVGCDHVPGRESRSVTCVGSRVEPFMGTRNWSHSVACGTEKV